MIHKNRVLVVGCGKIAGFFEDKLARLPYSHGSGFYQNQSFVIAGCVDCDGYKARKFSEKFSIEAYGDDVETIIDQTEPHVVSICTPNATHYDVVKKVLGRKRKDLKLIFVEKPVCSTPEELDDLVLLSKTSGIPVLVNMSRRYHPWYRYLREQYAQKKFGDLIRGDILYSGGWKHNGVHAVDTIDYLFSGEYSEGKIQEYWESMHDGDPTYTVKMGLEKNSAPFWLHGFNEKHYQVFDCDLKFEQGRLQITNFEEEIRWEQVSINSLGERVLIRVDLELPTIRKSCLEEAVLLIESYLHLGAQEQLVGYRVQDVVATMRIIWAIGGNKDDGSD